jgi:hypothetical protein
MWRGRLVVLWLLCGASGLTACGAGPPAPGAHKADDPAAPGVADQQRALRHYTFTFDVSSYQVASPLGCTHQGIGSRLYVEDRRPDGVVAQLRMPEILNRWYDHGRTVNYQDGCSERVAEAVIDDLPVGDSLPPKIAKVRDCILKIPDGPCDAGGSCNYCLPYDVSLGGQAGCTDQNSNYVGGHNSNSDARLLRALWDGCVGTPHAAWRFDELCGGAGLPNHATCDAEYGRSQASDSIATTDACATGAEDATRSAGATCMGKQPICGPTGAPVCGLG